MQTRPSVPVILIGAARPYDCSSFSSSTRGAEADYRRGLTLNPNYATGHEWYADYLRSTGRGAESRREIALAYKLDPFSPAINAMMCYSLFYERKYREALAFSKRAAELDSRFGAPVCVVYSFVALGDHESALRVLGAAENRDDPPARG